MVPERAFDRVSVTILFLDVVESVRIMEADEAEAVERWLQLAKAIEVQIVEPSGGRVVKRTGDGMLLEFATARNAVAAALGIRELAVLQNTRLAPDRRLVLRFSIATGEAIRTDDDLYGHMVNTASRLLQLAGPNEIVVAEATRDQLSDGLDADIEDLGKCYLRHVAEPLRAFRLGPTAPCGSAPPAASPDLRATIAVIPFVPRTPGAAPPAIGEIIAEEVIRGLGAMPGLAVLSRLSTTGFADRPLRADQAGAALGADYIVHGRIALAENQLHLSTELVDTGTGCSIWTDRLVSPVNELFEPGGEMIAELVYRIASSLAANQLESIDSSPLPTLKSYTLLLGAVTLLHRLSRSDFELALRMLEELSKRYPRQAIPLAWLADWHVMHVNQGWSTEPDRDAGLADIASRRALEANPRSALALTMRGSVDANLLRRLDDAEAHYNSAISRNPSEPFARLLRAALYAFTDRGAAAVEDVREALRLSPYDPHRFLYESIAASAHLTAGHDAEALLFAKRSLRRNRAHASSLRVKSVAEWRLGHEEAARSTVSELLRLVPGFTLSGYEARSPNTGSRIGRDIVMILRYCGVPA
jgi:class 3 adenylate cyclase/TolB-like protein